MQDRWQQINSIFHDATLRAPDERAPFLDEVCSGDEELRREVESLLTSFDNAASFTEQPTVSEVANPISSKDKSLASGQRLSRYHIIRSIGSGGMGEVYLAQDTQLKRQVALKVLPSEMVNNRERLFRFEQEARAASALNHPNILTIYEIGVDGDIHFIATEFIDGETLRRKVQTKPLDKAEALDIVYQIAMALDAAHRHGIIHRDIKPDNIMVRDDGLVKVLDFGLVKLADTNDSEESLGSDLPSHTQLHTLPGVVMGTVRYMSPEQARGKTVDARTDIWSLGVVLYELLSGQPPFMGETANDIIASILRSEPASLPEALPTELRRILTKSLQKNADERYQTAKQMSGDLKNLQNSLSFAGQLASNPLALSLSHSESPTLVDSQLSGDETQRFRSTGNLKGQTILSVGLYKKLSQPRVILFAILGTFALAVLVLYGLSHWWNAAQRPTADALYWYNKGTNALRDGAYYTASKTFERAIQIDDQFALAHARLAEAYMELDSSKKAGERILTARMLGSDAKKLGSLDTLYIQAITNLNLRKFNAAIENYSAITQQVPPAERVAALLDLGRAYEKNDQLDKARETYLQATTLAPQEAAGFLRLGIIYGQQNDKANALEAFKKAEELYLNDSEGIAEVLYQRGVLYNNLGELKEARGELQKAFSEAEANRNLHQQIKIRLELSRNLYSGGDTAQAQQIAQEAINKATDNNLVNLATQGLIEVGNACRTSGKYDEAENYLQQALRNAQIYEDGRNKARALVILGGLRITRHDADGGLAYIAQALAFYEGGGYRREAALAYYRFGSAYELKGEYEAALQAYEQQRQIGDQVGDQRQVANAERGIGIVFADLERYPEALTHFNKSYEIYRSLGSQLNMGYNLINRGNMLWHMGSYDDAKTAFSEANAIAERPNDPNKQILMRLSLLKAEMLLSENRFADAIAEGKKALALNINNEQASEAKCAIGLAQTRTGAKQQGRKTCEEAVEMAKPMVYQLLLPKTQLALAEALLESGDAEKARNLALQIQEGFAHNGQQESEWRCWTIAARADALTNDLTKAQERARHAEDIFSKLEQNWGGDAFKLYLSRPDVLQSRNYLSQILAGKP